jgi:hypothetical protein
VLPLDAGFHTFRRRLAARARGPLFLVAFVVAAIGRCVRSVVIATAMMLAHALAVLRSKKHAMLRAHRPIPCLCLDLVCESLAGCLTTYAQGDSGGSERWLSAVRSLKGVM